MKNNKKQIQINEDTFVTAYKLVLSLEKYEMDKYTRELQSSLKNDLEGKIKAIKKRKAFTEYKTAPPESEIREIKRKEYINISEISKKWQSEKENPL